MATAGQATVTTSSPRPCVLTGPDSSTATPALICPGSRTLVSGCIRTSPRPPLRIDTKARVVFVATDLPRLALSEIFVEVRRHAPQVLRRCRLDPSSVGRARHHSAAKELDQWLNSLTFSQLNQPGQTVSEDQPPATSRPVSPTRGVNGKS